MSEWRWHRYMAAYDGTLSLREESDIMWSDTAYPFCDVKTLATQIRPAIRAKRNRIPRCDLCGMKVPHHERGCFNLPEVKARVLAEAKS